MIEFILPVSIALSLCFFYTAIKHEGFLRWLSLSTMVFIAVVNVTLYNFIVEANNATI